MGRNRPSNEDAPRVPGEERSGRGRPIVWIVLGLILLLLLALLIPFACQGLRGSGDQGSGGGSGAQGGGAQQEEGQGGKPNDKQDSAQDAGTGGKSGAERSANAQENTGAKGTQATGSGGSRGEVDAVLASIGDRSGDGTMVTIPKAKLEGAKGWLAVRAAEGSKPGAVLGHAALKEGTNTSVRVKLEQPIDSSRKLYAVVHAEDPADGKYTFPDGDPPIVRSGKTTLEPLYYTIKGSAEGTSGEQAGVRGGDLPETGGVPPSALLTGELALLLSSLVCLFLALRQAGANGS